jgi:N-acetylglucosaminyl-diphospho-decaprenol L-rhamnosyltransferase
MNTGRHTGGAAPTVGVVTIVAGRRIALSNLLAGLCRQVIPADRVVVARMGGRTAGAAAGHGLPLLHVDVEVRADDALPLAAARNAGARACGDVDVIVFLDVDCIPGRQLVATYGRLAAGEDALVTGTVGYLPAGVPGTGPWTERQLARTARPHAARPLVAAGAVERDHRHELAWTTSLAVARSHFRSLAGFDERFVGYGAEDTDFAYRAALAGLHVAWTGDAPAFHQHHGREGSPVEHVDDIVRNATLFHELHGWFPMHGWLHEFADLGLVEFDPGRGRLRRLDTASSAR